MQKPGLLITLEGGEGGGKTTQVVRLRERLERAGKDVLVLREPGGTVISEQIREVVLSSKNIGMADTTEVLLFQAARAQIYRELVLPSLQVGKIVLMDRSRDSSVAYQGIVRGFGKDTIELLNDISTKNTYPDLTLLLDVEVKTGLKRRSEAGDENRMEMENVKFHQQVRDAYLQIVKDDQQKSKQNGKPSRWVVIDASQTLDEVEIEIWKRVEELLKS